MQENENRLLEIPRVSIPFSGRIDPRVHQLEKLHWQWCVDMGLVTPHMPESDYLDLKYTWCGCCYSYGATLEGARIITDLTAWYFIFDDQHDRCIIEGRTRDWENLSRTLREVLRTPGEDWTDSNPIVRALADILTRLRLEFSDCWYQRLARHFSDSFSGYDREFEIRSDAKRDMDLDAFIPLRRLSVAMIMWMDMVELAAQTELPQSTYHLPDYQVCLTAAADFAALCNDLHSHRKEAAAADINNIVTVISRTKKIELSEAVAETVQRMEDNLQAFLAAERRLLQDMSVLALHEETKQGLHRCLMIMRDWFANMDKWHRMSTRYEVNDEQQIQSYNEDLLGNGMSVTMDL